MIRYNYAPMVILLLDVDRYKRCGKYLILLYSSEIKIILHGSIWKRFFLYLVTWKNVHPMSSTSNWGKSYNKEIRKDILHCSEDNSLNEWQQM